MPTSKIILSDIWTAIDTSPADTLITIKAGSGAFFEISMNDAAPAAGDEGHFLTQPVLIPKGVPVFVRGSGALIASQMTTMKIT